MTYSITLQIKNNIITFKEYLLDGIIDKKFLSHTRVVKSWNRLTENYAARAAECLCAGVW